MVRMPKGWEGRATFAAVLASLVLMPRIGGAIDGGLRPARLPDACPTVPDGEPIAGLVTGQMITAGDLVTLRFSSKTFACDSWSNDVTTSDCRSFWNFTLTIPRGAISVGTHSLSAIGAKFGDVVANLQPTPRLGCGGNDCGGSTTGVGSVDVTAPSATLEIRSMAENCIAGKLTGVRDPIHRDGPSFDGEFFALTCAS